MAATPTSISTSLIRVGLEEKRESTVTSIVDSPRPSGAVAGVRSVNTPVTCGRIEPGTAAWTGLSASSGSCSRPVSSATRMPVSARTCRVSQSASRSMSSGTDSRVRLRTTTSITALDAASVERCTTSPSEMRPGAPSGRVENTIVSSGTSDKGPHGAEMVRSRGRPETSGEVTEA